MDPKEKTLEQVINDAGTKINDNNGKIMSFMESVKDYVAGNFQITDSIVKTLIGEIVKKDETILKLESELHEYKGGVRIADPIST